MNQLLAIRAYIRVVEATAFSRAADQLELPRSTVSKLITDLEKHLGVKLINRTICHHVTAFAAPRVSLAKFRRCAPCPARDKK
ncbi:LysR family transcriptional regulator [Photorhabdus laumondii]|uniref:LysR family transcriptional regulator n=1 Tax=Photorhabdus laumondii TaxID=2218628 RepID=UPI0033145329